MTTQSKGQRKVTNLNKDKVSCAPRVKLDGKARLTKVPRGTERRYDQLPTTWLRIRRTRAPHNQFGRKGQMRVQFTNSVGSRMWSIPWIPRPSPLRLVYYCRTFSSVPI